MGVEVLHPDQVWDLGRGCFFVNMKPDGKAKFMGEPVYTEASGRRFIVVPRP